MIPETDQPEGWRREPLKDAARLIKDKVDPASISPETPYIGLEHVEAHTMRLLGNGQATDVKSTKSAFQAGDVLYGKLRPYLNKVVCPNFDGICSTDFLVFSESSKLESGYLAYYLNQLWLADQAHHLSNGVELPRVNWESLSQLPIDYPPSKADQRSIVAQIERTVSLQFSAASHVSAGRRAIEQLRQAILATACSGRLTADWRDEYPASAAENPIGDIVAKRQELLGTRKQPNVAPADAGSDLPEQWALSSLASVSTRITSGSRDWSPYYGHGTGTFVMAQNVRRGYLDWSFRQAVDPPTGDKSRDRSQIALGDLLVTIVGANTGDVGPVTESRPEHYVCQSVALLRPADTRLTPFLNLWFNSPQHGRQYLDKCMYGAGRPHLSFEQLKSAPVAMPSFSEQAEIVRRARELLSTADALLTRIDAAAKAVERSSQAILVKAFRGELLSPQKPPASADRQRVSGPINPTSSTMPHTLP